VIARTWILVALLAAIPQTAAAQQQSHPLQPTGAAQTADSPAHWNLREQLESTRTALVSLPIAAVLGAVLAFRPQRRGTPPRSAAVIQTQMILAVVGAIVMLVVGASLARAFGIVGAASLVRYRAKVDDPKDAGVMLSTLSIGLASGVGLYALAAVGTFFVLGMLWLIESLEPERRKLFTLRVAAEQPNALRPPLEQLLRRQGIDFELRTTSDEEVCYEVQLPLTRRTDRLASAIRNLAPGKPTAVEWEEKKAKS
jgi:uncharacterized membrane protein YhiD involved in acid resistance